MLPGSQPQTQRMAPTQAPSQPPADLGIEMQAPKTADKEGWGQESPPESARTQTNDNPTGRAIACWTPQVDILCFVRAPES